MNNEFKKIKLKDETRYVLECASSGATSSGSIASVPGSVGKIQKRSDNILTQEEDKQKIETSKPRNFVAKNAKMGGAGVHTDKKKQAKQGYEKHKKNEYTSEGVVHHQNLKKFEPLQADNLVTLQGAKDNLARAKSALSFATATKDKDAYYRAKFAIERFNKIIDTLEKKNVSEEIGYDEVNPSSASYILRKLDNGTPIEDILIDFPELGRYLENIRLSEPDYDHLNVETEIKSYLNDLIQQDDDNYDDSNDDEYMENLNLSLQNMLVEKAPPGEKYERMVKHIKKGYSKDGKLTDKEKSIAFATAWKEKNKTKK